MKKILSTLLLTILLCVGLLTNNAHSAEWSWNVQSIYNTGPTWIYSSVKVISPRIIYVAFKDSDPQIRFAKSVDGGETWTVIATGFFGQMGHHSMDADASNPNTIFITYVDGADDDLKILKSTDGGQTWGLPP